MAFRFKTGGSTLRTDAFSRPPQPQMDWEALRRAKFRCEHECTKFRIHLGDCSLGLVPDMNCLRFNRGPDIDLELSEII